jgi:archaellum component FlaC
MNNNLENKLDIIISKLERIEKRLDIIENSCDGMDNHIGFVNGIYTTVRNPLSFLLNRINRIQGNNSNLSLPTN